MSGQDGNASIIAEYQGLLTESYVGYAALVLLLCEHIATFPAEVYLFWRKGWTGASVLFFLNRYTSLLYNLVDTTGGFGSSTDTTCLSWSRMDIAQRAAP
ncbi:hypothetical protein C8Q74DRAFT_1267578 [Fomes fomentarius]|nr:hypothetical protein C8Q74DRAFT_1267578 [Fomes fomentarius]